MKTGALLLLALAVSGDPPAPIGKLIKALRSRDLETRDSAATRLVALGEVVRPHLKKRLRDPDPELRNRAASILFELDTRRIRDRLSRHWGRLGKSELFWISGDALRRLPVLRKSSEDLDRAWPITGPPSFLIVDSVPVEFGRKLSVTVHTEDGKRISSSLSRKRFSHRLRRAKVVFWSDDPDPRAVERGLFQGMRHPNESVRKAAARALRWHFRAAVVDRLLRRPDAEPVMETLRFLTGFKEPGLAEWWRGLSRSQRKRVMFRRCGDAGGALEREARSMFE